MKREAEQALDSLRNQNIELGNVGTDGTPDITAPSTYEQRDVVEGDDGTWGETITEQESPVKKDIDQRASELEGFERDVTNYENLAKIGDNKVLQILGQINDKKAEIVATIGSAVSAGCSVLVGDGIWGPVTVDGVVLGPANTQTVYNTDYPVLSNDTGFVLTYDNLNNYKAEAPFTGTTSSTLTGTNVGTGFSTGCVVNNGGTVGMYKTITGAEGGACGGYRDKVFTLAAEINTLRDSLGTDWDAGNYAGIVKDTIEVKDMKTGSETMVWGYKSEDEEAKSKKESSNSLINTIENQSEFQ